MTPGEGRDHIIAVKEWVRLSIKHELQAVTFDDLEILLEDANELAALLEAAMLLKVVPGSGSMRARAYLEAVRRGDVDK